jgi:transposase
MLNLPPSVRIFVCLAPTDLRKSFDGLAQLVQLNLAGDPLSGHFYVFGNKRGDRLKLLYWDHGGFCLWYKRLEQGCFVWPKLPATAGDHGLEMRAADFAMLLDGVDLESVKRRRRYQRPQTVAPA